MDSDLFDYLIDDFEARDVVDERDKTDDNLKAHMAGTTDSCISKALDEQNHLRVDQGELCIKCRDIFDGNITDKGSMKYCNLSGRYDRCPDEVLAASSHCFICRVVWNKVLELGGNHSAVLFPRCTFIEGILEIRVQNPERGTWLGIQAMVDLRGLLRRGPNSSHTNDPEVLELASRWLQECIDAHPGCRSRLQDTDMPTRVLELESNGPETLRLLSTEEEGLKAPYMTLSHVWGSAEFFKLTSVTFQRLLDGIPLSLLPKTFRDAAHVARVLGVKFLWIDSLCIFQDSIEDWIRESSRMSDVYKGTLCNLAATGSADSNGGLFHSRNPSLIQPCIITTNFFNRTQENLHLREHEDLYKVLQVDQAIFRRGWVVQERILPSRVLHFGRNQVFWECGSTIACETYPKGFPDKEKSEQPLKLNSPLLSPKDSSEPSKTGIYKYWAKIVWHYSGCLLTKSQDKLVAIYGVARAVHQALGGGDAYMAGLWRGDFLHQITWLVHDQKATRPQEFRAPSWSWASVDGVVRLFGVDDSIRRTQTLHTRLLDFNIEQNPVSSFGQVTGGHIRLSGPLLTVLIEPAVDGNPDQLIMNGQSFSQFNAIYDTRDPPPENIHFILIRTGNYELERLVRTVYGLLIYPTTKHRGQFRRCGVMNLYVADPKNQDPSSVTPKSPHWPTWNNLVNDEWLEYESYDGIRNYTISIV